MLTETDVLDKLDRYMEFITLNHPYVYLIDCRLNVFRNDMEQWCIVSEVLGYIPSADSVQLALNTYGNCFLQYQDVICPIDQKNFSETIEIDVLQSNAEYWIVRGEKAALSHNKEDYKKAGIELKELERDEISAEEVARLVITKHRNLFRATDEELYTMVPKELQKILVLDEWYHNEYEQPYEQHISQEQIDITYAINKQLKGDEGFMDYDAFVAKYKENEQRIYDESYQKWEETKPSRNETWQQIAKVIATGDPSFYQLNLAPNTHWKFWPESGSM